MSQHPFLGEETCGNCESFTFTQMCFEDGSNVEPEAKCHFNPTKFIPTHGSGELGEVRAKDLESKKEKEDK